ncbi:MAG: hypothetical protein HY815_29770 [Candidatus Riflebacteria bacterium]|nr:hypothetical protein [Candidatus Riflebacteria bacterium]
MWLVLGLGALRAVPERPVARPGAAVSPEVASAAASAPRTTPLTGARPVAGSSTAPTVGATPGVVSPPQRAAAGDLEIEAGRPLALTVATQPPESLWRWGNSMARALAPAVPLPPTTTTTTMPDIRIHWRDPLVGPRTIPIRDGVIQVSIPAGPPRTIVYFVSWRAQDGRFELLVPAPPLTFRARVVSAQPVTILEGTGTVERVLFGDSVTVTVRVKDAGSVRRAILFHRSNPQSPYATAAMGCVEGDGHEATWRVDLPRPKGLEVEIEYFSEILTDHDRKAHYGHVGLPHRIRLLDPTKSQ